MACIPAAALILGGALVAPAAAVDSTWLELPIDGNYNDVINWSPNAAPVNQGDTATFGTTNTPNITVGAAGANVDDWIFVEGSQDYTFTSNGDLFFYGGGLATNGVGVEIHNNDFMIFRNESSAGQARIENNAAINFNDSSSADNAILVNNAGGSIVFRQNSNAGNAAILNNNGLFFFASSSAGDSTIINTNTGTLTLQDETTAERANIDNHGIMRFLDDASAAQAEIRNFPTGNLEFYFDSTAGSASIVSHGNLEFNDNSSAGNVTVENHDDVYFYDTSSAGSATFDNQLSHFFLDNSSAGSATIRSSGTLAFDNNSTAANATITNDGGLGFMGSATAGNATITNNNLIQLGGNATLGTARVINSAGGIVDISGLVAGSAWVGSIEGGGQIALGTKNLFSGGNDLSTEFSGVITGDAASSFVKEGAGALTLSGVNTYTGSTYANGGSLIINGSIATSSIVNVTNGGRLGGTGTVADTNILGGGTLAPGNSIGMLNVAGSVIFSPGSVLETEVNSAGQSDLLDAIGIATLNGGTVEIVPFPDFALDTPYTILSAAGGVGGTFDGVGFGSNSLFLTPSLTYGANDVFLNIAQTAGFESAALTPNQIAAAGGAQSLGGGPLFTAIALLGTQDEARAAFDAISGEIHASAKTALIEDSRHLREAANSRVRVAFEAAEGEGTGIWGHAFGAIGRTNGDGNAAALDRSLGGVFAGADAEASSNWVFGALAGYSHSNFNVTDRASSGSADSYHLGAYGGGQWRSWALRFGGAYSWHNIGISRTAAFTGFSDGLSSTYSSGTAQLFGELGYGMKVRGADIEPFANAAWVSHAAMGPAETGGAAGLTGTANTLNTTFTTLGLRASKEFVTGKGTHLLLTGMAGWRHAFGAGVPTSTFSFAGGSPFTVAGVPIARDALALDLGADIALGSSTALGLAYSGQIASGASSHSLKASVGARF